MLDRMMLSPALIVDPRNSLQTVFLYNYLFYAYAGNRLSGGVWAQENVADKDVTAYQLYYQFSTGTGKDKRAFDENSVMGSQMLQASFVQRGIEKAYLNARSGNYETFDIANDLKDVPTYKYPIQFANNALGDNPALAFQGSIGGKVEVGQAMQRNGQTGLPITITMQDFSSAESATRMPPLLGGYVGGNPLRAAFTDQNPFGLNAPFRTIEEDYTLHVYLPLINP